VTLRRLSALQWFGLLGGAAAWIVQFLGGFWVTQATCNTGTTWSIDNDAWQLGLLASGAALVVLAQAAAAIVFVRTRGVGDDAKPPHGRLHFLAGAALVANILFGTIMVLSGVASVTGSLCRGA
jgi:hypothetical protein